MCENTRVRLRSAVNNYFDKNSFTPLHIAVDCGDAKTVKLLLDRNADVNAKDYFGQTALHVATYSGHLKIAEELLNHGADINCLCTLGSHEQYTPLYYAALHGHEELVKLLLSKGADVNVGGENDVKPVYIATQKKHAKIVKLLLSSGADVNAQDKNGDKILKIAVSSDNVQIVEHILQSRPDVNNTGNKASLSVAIIRKKKKKIVEMLLQYGFTVNRADLNDHRLLLAAIKEGLTTVVEDFLNHDVDVNSQAFLHCAAKYKQTEFVKLLINNGAIVNVEDKQNRSPLFYAVKNDDTIMTEILLKNGAFVKDNSLLEVAVQEANLEIVKMLLPDDDNINLSEALRLTGLTEGFRWESLDRSNKDKYKSDKAEIAKLFLSRGALINNPDQRGTTVLYSAVKSDNTKLVAILLENNANVNAEDCCGSTALHASVKNENVEIINMLLKRGADVNAVSDDGLTALYIASKKGNKTIVDTLLKHGAKYVSTRKRKHSDSTSRRMENPLCIAAKNYNPEVLELLLAHGIDVNSRSIDGGTALHSACSKHNVQNVRLLLNYGADINAEVGGYSALDAVWYERLLSCTSRTSCLNISPYRFSVIDLLKIHVVKMKAANMYVSEQNLRLVDFNTKFQSCKINCEKEMETMKHENIGNTNVSFYDVFSKDVNQITAYARNRNIVDVLESTDLNTKFPMYSNLIRVSFRRGQKQNSLLRASSKLLGSLVDYKLPEVLTDVIVQKLSNADLELFIDACKSFGN